MAWVSNQEFTIPYGKDDDGRRKIYLFEILGEMQYWNNSLIKK